MGTSPTTTAFTGVSSYASDLVQVITRAVGIASMPLTQLSNQKNDLTAQQSALNDLDQKFTALQSSLSGIHDALGPASYSVESSDPGSVRPNVSAGAAEGDYTIDVINPGSCSVVISGASLPPVADPTSGSISSASEFTLSVDGQTFSITPASGSLTSLAKAINDSSAGIRASILNTGGSQSPEYRLVLRSASLGAVSMQLREGSPTQDPAGADLLQSLSIGSKAQYTVGGLGTVLESGSRTITIAPGLTADLVSVSSAAPVTITVGRSDASVSSAISAFVGAYNAVVDALDQQVGSNAGALSGQPVVRAGYEALRNLTQYQGSSGAAATLTSIGVELDQYGKLSFNAYALSSAGMEAISEFLGDSSQGFLQTAVNAIDSMEDASSGTLKTAMNAVRDSLTRQDDLIDQTQQRILDLEDSLKQQMADADTLLASLESKRDYMKNLFQAMMKTDSGAS